MFLAIIFIVLGLFMFLNALGIVTGNFWGLFWAIVFLAIGFKLMARKGKCPMCEGIFWSGKFHDKMHRECGCGCECEEETDVEEEK
jgi:predicted membrane protein